MLASFDKGKEIIKLIVIQPIPISIFSYVKPIQAIFEDEEDKKDTEWLKNRRSHNNDTDSDTHINDTDSGTHEELLSYRNSPPRPHRHTEDNQSMVSNENVLTVLIEDLSYELFQLLFNRILSDSKKLGPGCLSSLTDALLLLQEEGNVGKLINSKNIYTFDKLTDFYLKF